MKKRLDHIDRAKGILIILMVIGHVWQSGFLFDLIYAFHMPAFFAISGMLMAHTESYRKPFPAFVKSRILAYGIPFMFIECLGVLTDIIRNGVTLNWKGYLFNTLTFNFNDPNLWFLVNLCLIELMMAGLMKATNRKTVVGSIAAVLFAVRYFLPTEFLYISTISSVFKYNVFFVFGFFGRELLERKNRAVLSVSALLVLAYALCGGKLAPGLVKDLGYMISGLCGTYVTMQTASAVYPEKVHRILAYAGKNTLIIYGTHHIYYAALGVLMGVKRFAETPLMTGVLILVLVTALEIPTICIINRWFPLLAGKPGRKQHKS